MGKRVCTLGQHTNDEQLLVTQQRIFIGDQYFSPSCVLNYNYPTPLMWYRKNVESTIYSTSLVSTLLSHFETIWPLYIQSFAKNPISIYGDIMSTSGLVLLNSDKTKEKNSTENKNDDPTELLDESYANEAKNSKLLSFTQNYFIKTNLNQNGDSLKGIPFQQENNIASASADLTEQSEKQSNQKLNMVQAEMIGMNKLMNSQKLYQCHFDNK